MQHGGLASLDLNFYDADAVWRLVYDLGDQPTCAIIKHAIRVGWRSPTTWPPCTSALLECDERSAFGGIVACNRPIDTPTVERMVEGLRPTWCWRLVTDRAPSTRSGPSARTPGCWKRRVPEPPGRDFRQISGGFLVQEPHHFAATRDRVAGGDGAGAHRGGVVGRGARVACRRHVKSNAIVLVKDGQAVGIGAGQQEPRRVGRARRQEGGREGGGRRLRVRCVLPVPGRHRGGCKRRRRRDRATGRRDA